MSALLARFRSSRVGVLTAGKAIDQGSLFLGSLVTAAALGPARFGEVAGLLVFTSLAVQLSDFGIGFAVLRSPIGAGVPHGWLRGMRRTNVGVAIVAVVVAALVGSAPVAAGGALWLLTSEAYVAKVARLRADGARRVLLAETSGSVLVLAGAVAATVTDRPWPFVVALLAKFGAELGVLGPARSAPGTGAPGLARTWFGQAATYLANNVDYLVVGAAVSAADLSVYLLAFRATAALYAVTAQPITQDTFVELTAPGAAPITVMRRQLRRALAIGVAAAAIGVVIGLGVALVLGDEWSDVAPLTLLLAPAMPFRMAVGPLVALALCRARSSRVLVAELLRGGVVGLAAVVGATGDVLGAALGVSVGTAVGVVLLAAVSAGRPSGWPDALEQTAEPVAAAGLGDQPA